MLGPMLDQESICNQSAKLSAFVGARALSFCALTFATF